MPGRIVKGFAVAFALALGSASANAADTLAGLAPAAPQPAAEDMKAGLAVTYYFNKFNDTREVPDWAKYKDGVAGEPIAKLDYFVGDGEVLTSGRVDHVGAIIRGYIRFPESGTYTIAMHSNDGVDLSIGGQRVIHDPGVHSDRYSDLVPVAISEPGWYPLELIYFEKEHTSTVELYWLEPGGSGQLDHVPAEVLAHVPGEAPGS